MISLICQKKNSGLISSENKDLLSQIFLGENNKQNESIVNNNKLKKCLSENRLDSSYLKKFSSISKIEKETDFTLNSPKLETSLNTFTPSNFELSRKETVKLTDNFNFGLDPSKTTLDYFKKHPLKKLSLKNIKSMQSWINQKMIENPTDNDFYHYLNQFLAEERMLAEDIEKEIEESDIIKLRRKELIYKNWYLHVYEPIQKEIYKNMNSSSASYARKIRDLRYLEFLNQMNKKGCVYQDDYQPEEYDPVNTVQIGAKIPIKLKDPTFVPQRKTYHEEKTIYKCITGKKFSQFNIEQTKLPIIINDNETRADIDWNKWMLNHYSTMGSTSRKKSIQKCKTERNSGEFNLDWYRDSNFNSFVSSNSAYVDHSKNINNHQTKA